MKKIAFIILLLGSLATVTAAFGQGRNSYSGDANGTHIINGRLKVSKLGYGLRHYANTGDSTIGVDSTKFGTVKSVAVAVGTTGTNVNVSGSPVTGSGTVTINIPNASATNRGALTSADWSTFNNKVGGTGSNGSIPIWTGAKTIDVSSLYSNGSDYAMGGAVDPAFRLAVFGNQFVGGSTTYANGTAIRNSSNYSINITTNNGTGMDFNIPGGGYAMNFKEGVNSLIYLSNNRVLLCGATDRGTGAVQITGNITVTGANSSNTYKWEAAAGSAPSNTATPAGWLIVNVAGNSRYIPYYQ